MEISHAELEAEHYKAVRDNLEYRMIGQMEVMREELMMQMPCYLPHTESTEPLPTPAWDKKQWDTVQQLQAEVRGWRQKHAEALKEIDILKGLLSKKDDGIYK